MISPERQKVFRPGGSMTMNHINKRQKIEGFMKPLLSNEQPLPQAAGHHQNESQISKTIRSSGQNAILYRPVIPERSSRLGIPERMDRRDGITRDLEDFI
jgi:hypothetical protein